MLKKIVIVVVVMIATLLAYAATKPDTFHVQRAMSMKAPPEKVFPLINDLHSHGSWSPWEKMDPAMKKTLSGAPNGKGAVYEWQGNSQVGAGRIEITDSVPSSKVTMKLDMFTPFEAHNVVEFTLDTAYDSTRGHVGYARTSALHDEGLERLYGLRQNGRQELRDRSGQHEGSRGDLRSGRNDVTGRASSRNRGFYCKSRCQDQVTMR